MTEMRYLTLGNFALHLERVKARADAGGHSASEETLRKTYEASLNHLSRALAEIDSLWVYDNSPLAGSLRVVLESAGGTIRFVVDDPPHWLATALGLS